MPDVWIMERLLLEEKLSAKLTDEVYAAEGGDDRSTNSLKCIDRRNCLLHTSSVMEPLCGSMTASPKGKPFSSAAPSPAEICRVGS